MDIDTRIAAIAMAMALIGGPASSVPSAATQHFTGKWRNPKDTVHLELHPCGPNICGNVIWATEASKKAAMRFSGRELVGQQLFRDFKLGDDGLARGKVFVPDLGLTFRGAAQHLDADTIKVKGCVVGNLVCKSQIWTRIDGPPA